MKQIFSVLLLLMLSTANYSQIVADHTVVDRYDDIPEYYIDEVKKMLVWVGGMSHSLGYQKGINLLELLDPDFQATTWMGDPPPAYSSSYLRLGRPWMSNVNFWLEDVGSYCSVIDGQNSSGNPYTVIINGWSYETTWNNAPGGGLDPIYGIHWAGDANGRWGLDAADQALTGNLTCMDTYLSAINAYNAYFVAHDIPTHAIFSTGPVDENAGTENGFQRELKNQFIRNYVSENPSRILFDYADILVHNNSGERNQATWNDDGILRPHDQIHPDNQLDYDVSWHIVDENDADGDHIGEVGALRLAKAIWWLLARIAGWDGNTEGILVTGITVIGAGGSTTITQDNGTLALTATVSPSNATDKSVTWSLTDGTGQATINTTGLVTAVANGTVTARATANDGSGIVGSLDITISGQVIPVTGITLTGAGGATTITQDNGSLALTATVAPSNATNKSVTWSIANGTGQATISTAGVVTAISNGTVTARATANDGSGIVGSLVITITGQVIPVTGITVTGAGGSSVISSDNGQLQLTATVTPTNATNQTVTWSITNGTGQATINTTGLVTAVANGTVTARATANDGSGIVGSLVITISGQVIPVTGITLTGAGGLTTITQDNGTLALTATVSPSNATNKSVTWSLANGTGQATISSTGVVTAVSNGTVTARATANDGSGIYGQLVITISGQTIPVTGISVTGAGGSSMITTDGGQLQLTATVTPTNATNQTVTWSITNGTGQATINSSGLVTAVSGGTVTAVATATDGSGVQGTLTITITNQFIPVTGITVTGAGGLTTITQDNGTLALTATVSPANATNKSVTWSLANGTGQATISSTGVVTAVSNGTVTARATANDGSGIYGQLVITISGQTIPVTKIDVAAAKGEPVISTCNGTLQLSVIISPENATDKTVTWSVINETGQATVNSSGLVTAIADGTVIARATANDGSGVFGDITISIINQIVLVTGITVTGEGGITTITTDNGTLRLLASIVPSDASNKSVTWSMVSGNGHAELSEEGILTARTNGKVVVRAMANDGSNIYGQTEITLTNQIVSVSSIKVKVKTKSSTTTTVNGELALTAEILPEDATEKSVSWSVIDGTGTAVISDDGILKGVAPGEVIAVATSLDGSGVAGELAITINLVESIKIKYTRNEVIIQVPEYLLPAKASLHNLYGSHIQSKVIDSTECTFDISELLPGMYVVSVYNSIVQDATKIMVAY